MNKNLEQRLTRHAIFNRTGPNILLTQILTKELARRELTIPYRALDLLFNGTELGTTEIASTLGEQRDSVYTILRRLMKKGLVYDGRVVLESWDPATEPNPEVLATHHQDITNAQDY